MWYPGVKQMIKFANAVQVIVGQIVILWKCDDDLIVIQNVQFEFCIFTS